MKKVIKVSFMIVFFILLIGMFSSVFATEDDYSIKISSNQTEWTTSDVLLMIEISTNKIPEVDENVAIQILLGEESESNKWTDLGSSTNIAVLKKPYTYIIKNNIKVSVRIISWKLQDKSDLKQLAIQTYQVSNIDKTNPIIEKIDSTITNNSIVLDIKSKDNESGIAKYTCTCEQISKNETGVNPKFEFTNLEENKEYKFQITVEDKMGNKTTQTQTLKTKTTENKLVNEVNNNAVGNTNITNTEINNTNMDNTNITNTNVDNTIANKIIPQIGKSHLLFGILLIIGYIIIKTKDRI